MTSKHKAHHKNKKKKNQRKRINNWLWILPVLVLIGLVLALVLTNGVPAQAQIAKTISVQRAFERLENGAFLLDVREPSEWNEAFVDGAVLIPLGELASRMDEIPADQEVLIICRSGNRSSQARDLLRAAGFEQTTSISGGINAWIEAGLPVVTSP